MSVCLPVCLSFCLVCLSISIEMDMEVIIKKPRLVLESGHRDLTNRGSLELIGHLFIDFLDFFDFFFKVRFGNWLAAEN